MDSNTRATRHRLLVFFLCLMVVVSYSLPMNLFKGPMGAQEAYAAGGPVDLAGDGTLEVTATDENNATPVNAHGETLQYKNVAESRHQNVYDVYVSLNNLTIPEDGRTIKVEVAEGIDVLSYDKDNTNVTNRFVDGINVTNKTRPVSTFRGAIWNLNDATTFSEEHTYSVYEKRTFSGELVRGTGDLTWHFTLSPSIVCHYVDMQNAITVTYTDAEGEHKVVTNIQAEPVRLKTTNGATTYVARNGETTINNLLSDSGTPYYTFWNMENKYTCPQGVSLSLVPGTETYYALSSQDTGAGTVYTLTTKKPIYGEPGGTFIEPLIYRFNVAAGTEQVVIPVTKTLTNGRGEDMGSATSTRTFKIAPEAPVVIANFPDSSSYGSYVSTHEGANLLPYTEYSNTVGSAEGGTFSVFTMRVPIQERNKFGPLYLGNVGSVDSANLTCTFTFDDSKAQILSVPVFFGTGANREVQVTTNTRTLTYTVPGTASSADITATNLGLSDGEYIKSLTYNVGVIPANSHLSPSMHSHFFYGKALFDETATGNFGEIKIYQTAAPNQVEVQGPLEIAIDKRANFNFASDQANIATVQGGVSGRTISRVRSYGYNTMTDWNLYIVVPEGATLDIENAYHGATAIGTKSVKDNITVSKRLKATGSDGKERHYYKISFEKLPLEDRIIGSAVEWDVYAYCWMQVYYKVRASAQTPTGFYPYNTSQFIEIKGMAEGDTNPYKLKTDGGMLIRPNFNDNMGLTVLALTDIQAQTGARTGEMTEDIIYDPGNPQTVLPIGTGADDKVLLTTTITNKSGVTAPAGTKVWQPIPKKGEDWSNVSGFNLLAGSKTAAGTDTNGKAPYSLVLSEKLEGVDTSIWKVEYGINVDPEAAGNGQNWDEGNGTWKENPTDAELKDVNCVRFTAIADIPALDANDNPFSESATFHVVVDTEGESVSSLKGATMIISPLIYRNLTTPEGVFSGTDPGEPTALEIAIGKVKGEVWHDRNRDGKWNDGETIVDTTGDGNYEVVLYGGPEGQKQVIKTGKVAADGTYRFSGLATGTDFDGYYSVRITNRDGKGKDFRGVNDAAELNDDEMIVSPKHSGSESGKTKHNAFTHNTATDNASLKGYAYSEPITAVDAENYDFNLSLGGHYNVGVYYGDNQSTNATVVKFVVDTAKGTLTAPTNQGSWVTVEDGDAADGTLSYSGAAVDKLAWPKDPTAKDGYEFKGWKVEGADDSTAKAAPTGDATFGYEDVTYEAVFSAKPYKVTYDTDGGEPAGGELDVPCGAVIKDAEGFPANPTKEGFIFGGWIRGDITAAETLLKDDDTMPAKPITLKAKWVEMDDFTVAFEENGGSIVNDLSFVKWTKDKLTEGITISKAGSKFLGWFIDQAMTKAYSGESYGTIAVRDTVKLITLYAMWEENSYEVKYLDKDGNEVAASRTMKWETSPITPSNAPEKEGHTFKGWYKEAALTNSYNNEAFKDLAASDAAGTIVNLYAKFEAISFTASFDPNGGSGTMEDLDITYGDGTKAPAVGFTRDGYVADGWNTKADGSGTNYAVGADISKLSDKDGKTVKLYPKWKEVTYNVKTEDGKKVTPSADTPVNKDTAKRGNEITGTPEGGSEGDYVIKNVGPANPTTGVAEVTVVPITYPVADDQGNSVTPSDDTPVGKDTKKGDVIKDTAGKPYVVNKVADKADPDTGKKPVTVKKVTYKVNDPVGNDITPKTELTDPAKGDEFPGKNEQTGKDDDYVINKVADPDPETGISKVTAIPVTYPVEDEQGKKITPSDETPVGKDTKKGDEIDSADGKPYVVNKIADKANPNTGEKVITVKPINYVVEDNSGNGVTPSEPLDHPVKGDVIEDPTGNEYVVNKVDPADPDTGDKPVTVIPVTYPVVDNQGNPVTPSDDTPVGKDTKKGDVIDDGTGKPYVVNKVDDKPNPDTGEKKVTVIPVTYDVEDPEGNDVTPKDELVKPVKGDEFEDPSGNEYVVNKVDDPNPDTGVSKVKAIPVTYPVVDNKGRPVYPADDENIGKDTAKGDEFDDENGKPYIVNKVDDKANPDTGEKKVTAIPVTYDVKDKGGNKVTPKDDLNKPVKGDIFPDKTDNDYVVNEVKKPNPDTGVSEVTAIPVTWPVKDQDGNDVTPKTPLKRPAKGNIFPNDKDDDYVVSNVAPVDPETGIAQVTAAKVTWPVSDKDGKSVKPKNPLKRPVKGNTFEDENGDVWTVDSVGEVDPATGIAKVTASRVSHTYAFTVGNGQGWTKGSTNGLNFTVKRSINDGASFGRFKSLSVDGKVVASADYTKEAGSVLIDLKPSYLEGLATGGHRITATFSDGIAEGSFTVHPKAVDDNGGNNIHNNNGRIIRTGDMTLYGLMIALMIVAAMTMIAAAVKRRHNA